MSGIKRIKRLTSFAISLLIIVMILDGAAKIFYPLKFREYVFKYAEENGIDPYLVFAIIKVESSFNPNATSPKNARGLMQITDRTGQWGAQSLSLEDFTVESLYDPEVNIRIGCWYLKRLKMEFNNNMDLVITAYNGGSGNVSQWLKNKNYSGSGTSLDKIPFKETENYVRKVKSCYAMYKRLYEKDFLFRGE